MLSYNSKNKSIFESEFQKFCDDHMAYLLDEGFKYKTSIIFIIHDTKTYIQKPIFRIEITKSNPNDIRKDILFNIKEIEDQLLQFLEYLKNDYIIMKSNDKYKLGKEIEIIDNFAHFYFYEIDDMFNNTGNYETDEKELNKDIFRKIEILQITPKK